ncbi:Glucose dehydrogenase [FAD, quinone] [Armadillidium nasatum]|uniref:Glucose dehydrogenase [FAD, quinone] n=1 Tax=Armadillidium nasatum TaxID=96803 RepID=A0A5N5SPR5_9CRUS|nr:Glucose dehydrogenase [FAD, quinone] [Armadillidium nasatum]
MAASLARSLWYLPTLTSLFNFFPNDNSTIYSPPQEMNPSNQVFDFVIVGGGTAGSVVASRLSEDPNISVLLLEAGGPESQEAQIPAVAQYLQLSELDWQYKSIPSSTSCLAMNDNSCNLPRGKVLGGSSSINLMLYVRGNRNDFDQWETLGNNGWGFDDILKYFKKSEDNKDSTYAQNEAYHGVGGLQKIKQPSWKTRLANTFLDAGKELGYSVHDINAENQTGFMFPQAFYDKGSRFSSSRSFLMPVKHRSNLFIQLHTLVTKVILDDTHRAHKVVYERENENFTVVASKEIILCGGAFGTPHLLMLSGIGPSRHLINVGIKPLIDLPVGRNLQDHVAGQLPFVINKGLTLKRSRLESLASVYQYTLFGSGPLSTLGGVEGLAFIHTKYSNTSLNWPDIEFQFVSGNYASDSGRYIRHTINLKDEYWDSYLKPLSEVEACTIQVKLLRPRSRGFVELASSNPKEMPKIVTNYMEEQSDARTLIEGMKIAKTLANTKLGARLYNRPIKGCKDYRIHSDKYWECFLRHITLTIYHYSGTAKMGPYWDPDAVVNPELRVYGTFGLRVVDASIFPTIPSGNTNAAVMMVAEKASDMIKEFWNKNYGAFESETPERKTDSESFSKLQFFRKHFLRKQTLNKLKNKSFYPISKKAKFSFRDLYNSINFQTRDQEVAKSHNTISLSSLLKQGLKPNNKSVSGANVTNKYKNPEPWNVSYISSLIRSSKNKLENDFSVHRLLKNLWKTSPFNQTNDTLTIKEYDSNMTENALNESSIETEFELKNFTAENFTTNSTTEESNDNNWELEHEDL